MKADVASSEGANNVELVRLYCEACPYLTPAQEANPLVRQGIDGFPMVMFWHNTTTGATTFLGKYNFLYDKSAEDCFGFGEGDESWEGRNNTSNRTLWKNDDFESMGVDEDGNPIKAWRLDWEPRYPDTDPEYTDISQLKEFTTWVMSTDPETATNAALPEPVTYNVKNAEGETVATTYTNDTADYRIQKFRNELDLYAERDSALFFYLFTETHLMIDNRAKNTFPSFIGEAVVG